MESYILNQSLCNDKPSNLSIKINEQGYYALELVASAPTSWKEVNHESLMVRVYVNGAHHQDIILFYGKQHFSYRRFLGELEPGNYQLSFEYFSPRSAMEDAAWLDEVRVEKLTFNENEQLAYKYSPKLYGRSVYSDYDNLYTDTPLEMIYFIEDWDKGKFIEYQMVFSHEDEGTPAQFLMAKWGRLLDIEYMVRVYLNALNEVDHVMYQGPHHVNTLYQKELLDGRRPILQTATCNGNFSDEITSDYSFFFLPSYEWKKEKEPREVVMERFPYVNDVMDWEAQRQLTPPNPDYNQVLDLENYLFIQSSIWDVNLGQPTIDFICKLEGEETIYSSSFDGLQFGSFWAAYTGPYHHFGTAIPLPIGKKYEDVEKIEVRLINDNVTSVTVKNVKILSYHRLLGLQTHLNEQFIQELNQNLKEKTVWKKERV
ncbi:hypothetical protein KO561_17940 [Radiobacillus kanasensis]|uniref:hypothetical protein n=1 Tax=Radiobacillus kanasensis TaxID=2844358 RepID=UPI001E4D15E0|nr:hypothetical protein [Radiobacillus kanasensis]UFT99044.1 hypothetical protein KO561_17940 [Radiobacillus kanasensis]